MESEEYRKGFYDGYQKRNPPKEIKFMCEDCGTKLVFMPNFCPICGNKIGDPKSSYASGWEDGYKQGFEEGKKSVSGD